MPATFPKGKDAQHSLRGSHTVEGEHLGTKHKHKGDRLERLIVTTLKEHGLEARRVPLSGAVKGYPGDVTATLAGKEWILECKSRKDFKTLYGWLQDRDALILKGDRQEPLVVLRLEDMLELFS